MEQTVWEDLKQFRAEEDVFVAFRGRHLDASMTTEQIKELLEKGPGQAIRSDFSKEQVGTAWEQGLADHPEVMKALQCYVNQCDVFQQILASDFRGKSNFQKPIERLRTDTGIAACPFVSTSASVEVAAKYAYGLKEFAFKGVRRLPNYNDEGIPENPHLGIVYSLWLTPEHRRQIPIFNIRKLHREGAISISTHFRNNIFSEKEITFVGEVPAQCVVASYVLSAPPLDPKGAKWDRRVHLEQFGISERRYKNMCKKILDENEPEKHVDAMLSQIIKAQRQDGALNYRFTIAERVWKEINERADRANARVQMWPTPA